MTLPVLLFILIPCSILIRKDLTPTDKIVYGLLRFYQHKNGSCWPSLKQLATAGGCSVRAISSSIGRLEKIGLLTVERAYRQNNVYIVQVVKDPTYLRVPGFILQMEGLSSLGKLVAAAVLYKAQGKGRAWPHQDTLAAELGCSRRSVIRVLQELEASGKLDVHHGGGGRRRGNEYRPTTAFFDAVPAHDPGERVTKVHPLRKQTEPEDLKRTVGQEVSSGGLSGLRHVESVEEEPQERAFKRLRAHGVHRKVAESLVYTQYHPPASIDQAIDNAIMRQAAYRQKGDDRFKPFNLAGYIVGSLNQARREAKIVRPSRLFAQARAKYDRAKQAKAEPYAALSVSEFEARRRRCIEQLRAATQ